MGNDSIRESVSGLQINIIGYGFVGQACGHLCKRNGVGYNVCDVLPVGNDGAFNFFDNLPDLVKNSENINDNGVNYYFICVPTPSGSLGECDTSIVEKVVSEISKCVTKTTVVIIKSTLVPGTCNYLESKYGFNLYIISCPEFLTEANYLNDIYNAKFVLLGTRGLPMEIFQSNIRLFKTLYAHNPNIEIISKSYEECELYKYSLNTFFATKITFFNEIHEMCTTLNVDYDSLKTLFFLEPRIGSYGTTVPGNGNTHYGYFLSCLPKEVRGMVKLQESLGLSSDLMSTVDSRNAYFNSKAVTE